MGTNIAQPKISRAENSIKNNEILLKHNGLIALIVLVLVWFVKQLQSSPFKNVLTSGVGRKMEQMEQLLEPDYFKSQVGEIVRS